MAATSFSIFSSVSSSPPPFSLTFTKGVPVTSCYFPSSKSFKPKISRLGISQKTKSRSKHIPSILPNYRSCLGDDNSETLSESSSASVITDDGEEATIDLKLPRRSLSVHFTCNACGGRTRRLINRLAYERGTVFVQCAGCFKHHKLVDNLGLVVEYDLREDDRDSNTDKFEQE